MTVIIVPVPARYLPERIEEKRREVEFLRITVRHQRELRGDAKDAEGALDVAERQLADLEAALPWCDTCRTNHAPVAAECPELGPCPDCGASGGQFCKPDCLRYRETPDGGDEV